MPDQAQNNQPLDPKLLDQLWDAEEPVSSEQRLRSEVDGMDPSSLAAMELATLLARALGSQGRFDDANALLDTVKNGHPLVLARVNLERGRLRDAEGDPAQAMPFLAAAVGHATMGGHSDPALDAMHLLTVVDEKNASIWARQGLDIIEASRDPQAERWRDALQKAASEG